MTWSFRSVLNVNVAFTRVARPLPARKSMTSPRLFSAVRLRPDTEIALGSGQARYVGRVLRLGQGDRLTVFDGRGGEFAATIACVTKQGLRLRVGEHRAGDRESPLRITLVQGVSRGDKMDVVVQKATELGVERITPVLTEFSVVKLDERRAAKRCEHWEKIARSACEQCHRNVVPVVDTPQPLVEWFGANASAGHLQLILRPDAAVRLPGVKFAGERLTLLVGPEGGFSAAEYERAAAAGLTDASLGPRIMRTETAALAAVSVAQASWGDLRAS